MFEFHELFLFGDLYHDDVFSYLHELEDRACTSAVVVLVSVRSIFSLDSLRPQCDRFPWDKESFLLFLSPLSDVAGCCGCFVLLSGGKETR